MIEVRLSPERRLAFRARDAEQSLEQLALAVALQTGDAEHFTLTQAETDARQARAGGEVPHFESDAAGRIRDARRIEPLQPAPDHLRDDLVVRYARGGVRGNGAPAAKDGQPVGDRSHLAHAVRYEDDQTSLAGEPSRELEQPLRLARRQCRRGLVENEDAGLLRQPLGDLDDLAFGKAESAQFLAGIERRKAIAREERLGPAAHLAPVDGAQKRARLPPEPDVALDRQVGNGRKLLEDRDDTAGAGGVGIGGAVVLAIQSDPPLVLAEDPGQDLDERALAGAVLAEQCVHLSGRCGEAGLVQRDDAAEPLG